MSKIVIVGIIIGIIAIGIAGAVMLSPNQSDVSPTAEEIPSEPQPPKGKDIQINLEDGIAMHTTP